MSSQRKISYRAGLFDRDNLNSMENIANSLSEFEAVINECNYVQALNDLWDNTDIVELILSGIPSYANYVTFEFVGMTNIPLNTWIVKHLPTDFNLFDSSFEYRLLCKLSSFHYFRTSSDDVDCNVLREHYGTVCLAPKALQTLSAITSLKEEEDPPESSFKKGKPKRQKQKTKHAPILEYNTQPLVDLNIAIPRTSSDAEVALSVFLGRLRDILEVCSLFHVVFLLLMTRRK